MQPLTRIRLLGGLTVERGNASIDRFATRKAASLLAYLSFHLGRRHSREELAERLWPEALPEVSRHRLRQALTSLRRQLDSLSPDSEGIIEADRTFVSISPRVVEVDTCRFEALVDAARTAHAMEEQRSLLSEAAALYSGELLPGFYDDWVLTERERIALAFLDASCKLALLLERDGDLACAFDVLYRALAADPLHEDAHLILIRFHAAMGRAGAARSQFATLDRLLRDHIGLAPDEATRALVAGLPETPRRAPVFQARPATTAPPPLPPRPAAPSSDRSSRWVYLTRFFGRERELRTVREMLAPGPSGSPACRLVTLVGGGGHGKTRLAVESANALRAEYGGRAWIVPLADVRDSALVPGAIVDAMGLDRAGERDPMGLLAQALCEAGPSLLVLDNAEQIAPAIEEPIADALARVPDLACLVTSRRAVGLEGERVVAVPPLPVPGRMAAHDALTSCASVRLLVDRIQARRPDFQVTSANAADVAELCAHLEGVPLAIELATAWSASLTPGQMLRQLRSRLDMARTGRASGPERHRSLRATLDWSRRLLGTTEQAVFARLSVFAGGFDLDAARFVCRLHGAAAGDGGAPDSLLLAVNSLVGFSLLNAEERDGEMRYRMPEIVREYASEVLGEAHRPSFQARHAEWFAHRADEARIGMRGPGQIAWLRRLDADRDNLDTALAWLLDAHDATAALRMAGALAAYWDVRSLLREGRAALLRALALEGGSPAARSRALLGLAAMSGDLADPDDARRAIADALELIGEAQTLERADAFVCRGHIEWNDRKVEAAEQWFAAAVDEGDALTRQHARLGLGKIALYRGKLDEARSHEGAGLAMARAAGTPLGILAALLDAGVTAWFQRDLGAGEEFMTEALDLCRQADDRHSAIRALWVLGNVARCRGRVARAAQLYAECLEAGGLAGARWPEPYIWEAAAHLCLDTNAPTDAVKLFAAAAAQRDRQEAARLLTYEVDELQELRRVLSARLGERAYGEAWGIGGSMSREAAVNLAVHVFESLRAL